MMTFQVKTVNTEKALESYISEILELWKRTGMIGGYSKLSFLTTNTESVICGKFQEISSDI